MGNSWVNHLYLIISCVLAIEILRRAKTLTHVYAINSHSKKASRVLTSKRISDHWKEKIIPAYSKLLFQKSMTVLIILLSIVAIFFVFSFFSNSFLEFTASILGIIESLVIVSFYLFLRKKLSNE